MSHSGSKKRDRDYVDNDSYDSEEEEQYARPRKTAKYKKLSSAGKSTAKTNAKAKIIKLPPVVGFVPIPLTVRLDHLYVLQPIAVVSLFADPAGCPSAQADGYWRGGQQIQARLGPRFQGDIKGNPKTYNLPHALQAAQTKYPARHFVSGHLLNGETGGQGNDVGHLTILSHNANMAQKGFDQPIKKAQHALHQFYSYLGGLMPTGGQAFIDALGYGIDIDIQVGAATMGPGFPENCVSTQIQFGAVIVGEPNLTTWLVRANFQNITASAHNYLAGRMAVVQNEVAIANGFALANP